MEPTIVAELPALRAPDMATSPACTDAADSAVAVRSAVDTKDEAEREVAVTA